MPTVSIPTDNPFYNTTTGINRAIWAYGLRNPYTTAFQPGTGRFFINDVGQSSWEEIDEGAAGRNFGWPSTEGRFTQSQFPNFTEPFYTYSHNNGTAITGGAFYDPSRDVSFPLNTSTNISSTTLALAKFECSTRKREQSAYSPRICRFRQI